MLWNNLRAPLMALLPLAMSATIAAAADVPYKAVPVAAYDWSGFYAGVHAGYGWSRSAGKADPLPSPQDVGLDPNTLDLHSKGALGGLQAGYNWQFAPNWVAGIEADISWSGIRGRQTDAMFLFGGAGSALFARRCRSTASGTISARSADDLVSRRAIGSLMQPAASRSGARRLMPA